ncbi:MAG: ribosome silencing factor [Atribacterota bacterium]|nr:ribosome silencing factor [Candidatus Atribacteria bacterium]
MNNKEECFVALQAAEEKKARDIVIFDLREVFPVADFWLICSAPTTIQTKTISDTIQMKFKEWSVLPYHVEGEETGEWILIDYGDLIIHIFREEERIFYQLEKLWRNARLVYSPKQDLNVLDEIH